ncbi:MAG: hypothetical protein HRK26_00540 [Rickettsiaceae bacterium H1]|nr:hypothetical protein [Rickettsiaceae bacterium H1]
MQNIIDLVKRDEKKLSQETIESLKEIKPENNYDSNELGELLLLLVTKHNASVNRSNCNFIKEVIEAGANVNHQDKESNNTPLHFALSSLSPQVDFSLIVEAGNLQLEKEVELGLEDFGYRNNITTLLKINPNLTLQNKSGKTPLHMIKVNQPEIVEVLLESNINTINKQDVKGNTPLHSMVEHAAKYNVAMLLKYDLILDIKNEKGKTPLELAVSKLTGAEKLSDNSKQDLLDIAWLIDQKNREKSR